MSKIFISYRREDSEHITGRIYDRLEQHFGHDNVFLDIDTIPLGVDFREHLDEAVGQCDLVLVVMGRGWLEARQEGKGRRLDDPADFVRIEIQSALARKIPVIPVLVAGMAMPGPDQLPKELENLAYRNALAVGSGADFRDHVQRLIRGIEHLVQRGPKAAAALKPTAEPQSEPKSPANAEPPLAPPQNEKSQDERPVVPAGSSPDPTKEAEEAGSKTGGLWQRLFGQAVDINIAGTWYSRPEAAPKAEWEPVLETPATVTLQPNEVYRLKCFGTVTDEDLAKLAKAARIRVDGLPALRALELECPEVSDVGLAKLPSLSGLQFLTLIQCKPVTDAGLVHLGKLSKLQTLLLSQIKKITDRGLPSLGLLAGLQRLELSFCDLITGAGLVHLRNLHELEVLNLQGCYQLSDDGLDVLSEFPRLQTLILSGCKQLTDGCLKPMLNLKQLHTLNLSNSQVTNAGLHWLAGLASLRYLYVSGCMHVREVGLAALKKLLPGCTISK